MKITFTLDGKTVSCSIRSGERLSEVLRETFNLESLRPDCRVGRCGRCLVFMDDNLVPTCMIPAWRGEGRSILTFAGLIATDEGQEIERAFREAGCKDCGFCHVAKVMVAAGLLRSEGHPAEKDILMALQAAQCRCTDPESYVRAVMLASEYRAGRTFSRADK